MVIYSKLKRVKTFQTGGKSKYVWLLENNIVKKAYNLKDKKQQIRFNNEVKYFQHVEYCDIVPKILHIDSTNGILYMTYVGKVPKDTKDNRKWLAKTMKELHLKWNLKRHRNGKPNYDVYIGNGCVLNDKMYVIDFGSFHYQISGPKIIPQTNSNSKD